MSATRRRAKARAREAAVLELDVRWAFRLGQLPRYAVRVSVCSCGRLAWLMPGATLEDHESFDQAEQDHEDAHQWEDDVA